MATAAAKRYARAVFELAQEEGDLQEWGHRIAMIRELLADPGVAAILGNPSIATQRREALVSSAPHFLDTKGGNLARLLVESGRIKDVPAIEEEFESLADQAAGRVRATVTTAIELQREDRDRIEQELSKQLKNDVRLTVVVDPRIIGGLKLQYGDRVVDASVATRLQQLRRRLTAT